MDIWVALAVMGAAAVAVGLGAARVSRGWTQPALGHGSLVTVLAMLVYFVALWDDPRMAALLPASSLIVVGNWFCLFLALLAGLAWNSPGGSPLRRGALVAACSAVGGYSLAYPFIGDKPVCGDIWDENAVCRQSSSSSCSAAAVATLLRHHGIRTGEAEMADLCFTRRGTLWQGMYRGLRLKAAGTGLDVVVLGSDVGALAGLGVPAVINVGIPFGWAGSSEFEQKYGWMVGVEHSVVYAGPAEGGRVTIEDPSVGRETWPVDHLRALWRGGGLALVRRRRPE